MRQRPKKKSIGLQPWHAFTRVWRRKENDEEVSPEQYEEASYELHQHLLVTLGQPEQWPWVYPVGNYLGEATQQIAVNRVPALNLELLLACQSWLKRPERNSWRCIVETDCRPETTIVIYPERVIFGKGNTESADDELPKFRRILADYLRAQQQKS